jgi:hypothetical protein
VAQKPKIQSGKRSVVSKNTVRLKQSLGGLMVYSKKKLIIWGG